MKQGKCCAGAQGAPELSPADMPAHGHEAHKAAGEADAAGMATGAHMGPPPGAAFDADGSLTARPGGRPRGRACRRRGRRGGRARRPNRGAALTHTMLLCGVTLLQQFQTS